MKIRNGRTVVAEAVPTKYQTVVSVALILALLIGVFGALPGVAVAANGEEPFHYAVVKLNPKVPVGDEPISFASQAAAIEYFVAKQRASRESVAEPTSFPSQAAAIEYFVARQQAARMLVGEPTSFPSQAAAIEYFLARQQAARMVVGEPTSFPSQAAAIEYFVEQNRLERSAGAGLTCSRPDGVLAANPELAYVRPDQTC